MKKFFTLLLLPLLMSVGMHAQSTVSLGYCAGECADKGSISTEGKAWVSGAIFLPADMLASYEGSHIVKLRGALASKIIVDSLVLWVRSSLKGENLTEAVITTKTTPKMAKGWNEAELSTPFVIPHGEGLYIGMSYRQKAEVAALSVVGSPMENACWVQWGADEKWEDMSSVGILSVEAVIEGSNLPTCDLGLTAALANTFDDASLTKMQVAVVNNGQSSVSGFTLQTRYALCDDIYTHHFDVQLGWGEKTTVEYQIPNLSTVSQGDIQVTLQSIDDGDDETATNNSIKAKFALVKKVLVEDFTTEPCGNCPRVSGYLHTLLSWDEFHNRVVAVCHHSGYKTDWLTLACDEKMASRFAVGYSPAIMVDRKPIWPGLHECPSQSQLEAALRYVMQDAAHVSINISGSYDETTHKLNVIVSGKRDELKATNPHLTVYLVENDVLAQHQSGATGAYYHQHVIRAYNSDFGEKINWEGNQYEYAVSFDVEDAWVKENMQIVALVANDDTGNNQNCAVDNVEQAGFPIGIPETVSSVGKSGMEHTEYFTLDGRRLDTSRPGMVIVRKTNADGHTRTFKMLSR